MSARNRDEIEANKSNYNTGYVGEIRISCFYIVPKVILARNCGIC